MNIWRDKLERYEEFLKSIPVEKYEYLRAIKTVEQDLPRELLPLEIFYEYYWYGENFADYEEVFGVYWEEKLRFIHKFIEKYFYGCSLQFVKEGFKARLYRTWMSILTQFHFQYLWNAEFPDMPLYSDHEMDSGRNRRRYGVQRRKDSPTDKEDFLQKGGLIAEIYGTPKKTRGRYCGGAVYS